MTDKLHVCPHCKHDLCMSCYKASWANAKAPNIECCECHEQNDKAIWCDRKFIKSEMERLER